MGEDEPLGNFSSAGSMTSLAPASSPAAPKTVKSNGFSLLAPTSQSSQSVSSFGSDQWLSSSNLGPKPISAMNGAPQGSNGATGSGKLSAQDLSFFEGL